MDKKRVMSDLLPLEPLDGKILDREFGALSAVELQGLSVETSREAVLQSIDLTIRDNDCFGIVGPTGGGKTVLLHCLLGLLPPTKGSVRLFGSTPDTALRRKLPAGFVPQFSLLRRDVPATVYEYVKMGTYGIAWSVRPNAQFIDSYVRELLTIFRIDHRIKQPVGSLAPGQQQLARIARALVARPRLLVLDEPFQELDPRSRDDVMRLLDEAQKHAQQTIVIAVRDGKQIAGLCKRAACLNHAIVWISGTRYIQDETWADPCLNIPSKDGHDRDRNRLSPSRPPVRDKGLPAVPTIQFWR